MKWFSSSGT
jgi:hypothetical protein